MEPVTAELNDEQSTNKHTTIFEKSKDRPYSSKSMHQLFSLLVIQILAIFIGALIGLLRKYGCTLMVNLVRRISNYVLDINNMNDYPSVHTPSAVNEILDGISTERRYGSSSISSLSWDPRFTTEAEIISQNIKAMNNQKTQTPDHSSSIPNQSNDSIIDIDLCSYVSNEVKPFLYSQDSSGFRY